MVNHLAQHDPRARWLITILAYEGEFPDDLASLLADMRKRLGMNFPTEPGVEEPSIPDPPIQEPPVREPPVRDPPLPDAPVEEPPKRDACSGMGL